jgi:hypothetical protein
MKSRIGPILHEALKRYRLNAVPAWSTLYGANLPREEGPESPDEVARKFEWTSITGNCWKIPQDNRVTLSFLGYISDAATLVQVRNFLLHFHKPGASGRPKGDNFNVWDWFDTGISAYWFPGSKTPGLPEDALNGSKDETASVGQSNSTHISHLIAPWRRIM